MPLQVALRTVFVAQIFQLHVDGNRKVRHLALLDRRANSQVGHRSHVGRIHDALVVTGDIHEDFVQLHILLAIGAGEITELHAGDRKHRCLIHLGVIQPV